MKKSKANWQPKKLNELGYLGRGKSKHRPRNDPILYGGQYPFIQTGDVKAANLYISDYSQTYNETGLAQSKLWEPETLLITIAANIAETAILGIPACFPDSIVGFVPEPSKANVRFVKYYIDYIKLGMQNISRGTTQDNLSVDKLVSFDILVPPLETQCKITAILSAYDDLIENNNKRIKLLEQAAHDLYREWFVYFRFPGHEDVELVDSGTDYGDIPKVWKVGVFTDVADVLSGGTPKTKIQEYWNGDIPFFSPKDAGIAPYVLETERNISELGLSKCNSQLYTKNTVFITARGTVGTIRLTAYDMAMNQSCYALVGKDGISQLFLYLLLTDRVDYLKQQAHGAVFDTIIVDTFRRLEVVLPVKEIVIAFDKVIAPIFEQILTLLKKNQLLRDTRDLLLPRLVSGDLDVTELEIMEAES